MARSSWETYQMFQKLQPGYLTSRNWQKNKLWNCFWHNSGHLIKNLIFFRLFLFLIFFLNFVLTEENGILAFGGYTGTLDDPIAYNCQPPATNWKNMVKKLESKNLANFNSKKYIKNRKSKSHWQIIQKNSAKNMN